LPAGDAAVAGFSGTIVAGSAPPAETQRIDKTYIDLDGPALRVIGLDRLGAPPQGQFVAAAKPFTVIARQIGQVYSLALDDAIPPNIYAAATSAYGLPIVVPDADGDGLPDRSRRGAPNAAFMPGLFGPTIADSGPGSIWKVDGMTGAVSLFANVVLGGVRNSGPALGGLTFDLASRQLFVADRDTGMIHRFTLDGVERGYFDHGVQGLTAARLPPVAFDPRKRIDLQNSAFDSSDPATWGYAPTVRRVFGLAVYGSRLYYAVASGLRIWSVAIMPDGAFGDDVRMEVAIPPGPKPGAEISTIAFDGEGRMLLAERDPPTGAYDYKVLASAGGGRALRLRAKQPGEGGTPFYWQADGDYAVGFPPDFTNGNGGLALGYGYDGAGNIDRASCGGSMWVTGEQLRVSPVPSVADRLRGGGPLAVNGLQGNALALVRPQNAPPFNSYFMSYADPAEQPGLAGHLGGIVIWQICPRAALIPDLLAGLLTTADICPRGYVEARNQCVPTPCKPDERYRDGKCVHECPPLRRGLRNECCPQGTTWDGRRCVPHKGPDLTIEKKILRCGPTQCFFEIVITNRGPGTYNGDLIVGDVASTGQITSTSADWTCTHNPIPSGNDAVACSRPNTSLAAGQSVSLRITVTMPNSAMGGIVNCAIVDPRRDGDSSNNISCAVKQPQCPAGQVQTLRGGCRCPDQSNPVNGSCLTPPKYCSDGSVPVNGTCPTPPQTYCADGSVPVNGACPPPPQNFCPPGQICNPPGIPPPGGTQPACQFPKTLLGGRCVCRPGTVGDDCHVPTSEKCKRGTRLVDGECVRPKQKRKSAPKSSDDPPSQSAPNIQLNIDIVPGLGGGHGPRGGGGGRPPGGGGLNRHPG
jgi:hypothetical protein